MISAGRSGYKTFLVLGIIAIALGIIAIIGGNLLGLIAIGVGVWGIFSAYRKLRAKGEYPKQT